MGTYLLMLIRKMEKGELDYILLIVGIVVGIIMIMVSIYRLCCSENGVPTEETTTRNLQVTQVDIIRIPPPVASIP